MFSTIVTASITTTHICKLLTWKTLLAVVFRLYDLRNTGYIEREEVSILAMLAFPQYSSHTFYGLHQF